MIRKLFTVTLILCAFYSNAQVKEKWAVRYTFADTASPWKDTDIGTSVAIDEQNNVYVTGSSMRDGQDIVTIKYNGAGIEQWKAIYSTTGTDGATSIAVDGQGNVYITGFTNSDCVTIKYNAAGVKQWESKYTGTESTYEAGMIVKLDGAGNVYSFCRSTAASFDFLTIKYNSTTGAQIWASRYAGPGNLDDYPTGMVIDAAGNVYVTGESRAVDGQTFDFATVKYNAAGVQQWAKIYNSTFNKDDKAKSVAVDSKGNVIVTGFSNIDATAPYMTDFLTIKYDKDGNLIWRKSYNGPGNSSDGAVGVMVDANDNIYVAGSSHSGSGDMDLCVVKYTTDSALLWVSRYNRAGGNTEELKAMTMDASANVYITGSSQGPTGRDYATVKFDSSGVQKWMLRYNGTGNAYDDPWSIAVNSKGVTAVTGASPGVTSQTDYATVMYADSALNTYVLNNFIITDSGIELQTYPNPFSEIIQIDYLVPEYAFVSLKIYNSLGQQIESFVNNNLPEGKYSAAFDGSGLTDGIYFCELRSGSVVRTSKLILQK